MRDEDDAPRVPEPMLDVDGAGREVVCITIPGTSRWVGAPDVVGICRWWGTLNVFSAAPASGGGGRVHWVFIRSLGYGDLTRFLRPRTVVLLKTSFSTVVLESQTRQIILQWFLSSVWPRSPHMQSKWHLMTMPNGSYMFHFKYRLWPATFVEITG